jgi:hypothetical protein
LLTFDPAAYAPASDTVLQEIYGNAVKCPCIVKVSPSTSEAIDTLKNRCKHAPGGRILLHYFGHSCRHPTSDGSVFVFSEDKEYYKPLKMANITAACRSCPLTFIFDCPGAAILLDSLRARSGVFAFFACGPDENLPVSADAPSDLFSLCLLKPYDAAVWWHCERKASVFAQRSRVADCHRHFLTQFLAATCLAIVFEVQDRSVYSEWSSDNATYTIFKNYPLAERILLSFNIHTSTLPALKGMSHHPLWNIWDMAIDFCTSLKCEDAQEMLFEMCSRSFQSFPSPGIYPFYAHFLEMPEFQKRAAELLLALLDESPEEAEIAAGSILPGVIIKMSKVCEVCLLLLAKMQVSKRGIDVPTIGFSMAKSPEVVRCGMLNTCISMSKNCASQFRELIKLCLDKAEDCAPYSGLLLGLLIERGKGFGFHGLTPKFMELCKRGQADVRATSVYLLGCAGEDNSASRIAELAGDVSVIVREQCVYAAYNLIKDGRGGELSLDMFDSDSSEVVRKAVETCRGLLNSRMRDSADPNPILRNLISSVQANGFRWRYRGNVFDVGEDMG